MAFTYKDPITGKNIFDVAEANIVGRSADGQSVVQIFVDGALTGAGTYTDTQARNAIKTKTQVNALTPIADPATATATQVATLLNSIITALKA